MIGHNDSDSDQTAATVVQVQETDPLRRTRRDYDDVAEAYDDLVRHDDSSTHVLSTAMITAFASLVHANGSRSEVLDVGCGPGQWTELLVQLGVPAYGMDLSPAMVAIASHYRPDLRYEVGSMLDLNVPDGSIAGILAHFSLIHLPPHLLPAVLAKFARAMEFNGPLLIGVQIADAAGDQGWAHYDHKASPAYLWTLDALVAHLRQHGFAELARLRIEPLSHDKPPAGYLLARHTSAQSA